MNPKTEKKILIDYLELIEKPDANESTYRNLARVLVTVGMLGVFYFFSDTIQNNPLNNWVILMAFVCGFCFGLGIWFSQMGSQTKLFIKHLSKDSIQKRIDEINS